ncbi:hypothetical protein PIB30_011637 [Stylosanthes scabra]|uniref:Uncharacterized protein n=1 Tax=Stylosanthes scabra TaxID=79078 RepID=A0ABU6W3X6_9FABA|nr:hypothetical protein [Stylosanthes scabra]
MAEANPSIMNRRSINQRHQSVLTGSPPSLVLLLQLSEFPSSCFPSSRAPRPLNIWRRLWGTSATNKPWLMAYILETMNLLQNSITRSHHLKT